MTIVTRNFNTEGLGQTAGYGAHAEGLSTVASGYAAHAEGQYSVASAVYSHAEGYTTTASGNYSHAEGQNSVASAYYARAGGFNGLAQHVNQNAYGSQVSNYFNRCQSSVYMLGKSTSSTAVATLTFDAGSVNSINPGANVLLIPQFSTYVFTLQITGRVLSGTTQSAGWVLNGMTARDSGAARVVGYNQTASWADVTIGTVGVSMASNYLAVTVQPSGTATTGWFGTLYVSEFSGN